MIFGKQRQQALASLLNRLAGTQLIDLAAQAADFVDLLATNQL